MNAAYEIVENLEILGLTPGTTLKEIRSAFRSLARTCHPDVAGPQSEKAFAALASRVASCHTASTGSAR